jgi:hypothetical protein
MTSTRRRIRALQRRVASRQASEGTETFDMRQPISQWGMDLIAVVEEYVDLRDSMSSEPTNQWRGGVQIVRENIPEKVLGPVYTRREFYELAASRGLESQGYSADEIAEMTPEIVVVFEEGIVDENGERIIDFEDDDLGTID